MDRAGDEAHAPPAPQRLDRGAIGRALRAGVRDFSAAPAFGLFFSAVYVAGGLVIWLVYAASGQVWWLVPVVLGFPLLGPFAAIGLYEVSRRLERGERLGWGGVLGVVFAHRNRQLPSMAAVILMVFLFWIFVAHAVFALFMGLGPRHAEIGTLAALMQGNGPVMLLIGGAIGAGFAGVLFAMTVVGLPVLLERDIDFITAIIGSFAAVLMNVGPMILWGLTIVLLLALGMAPLFMGLFVVLPVLGHASWHMYRELVR